MDRLKCELKLVYAEYFVKQASSIQEIAEILRELEQNQAMVVVIKLRSLLFTIPITSAFWERASSLLKRVNNYMRCSQNEQWLSNLVFISRKKDLFKKMKVERGSNILYNEIIDEFAEKKRRTESIYKWFFFIKIIICGYYYFLLSPIIWCPLALSCGRGEA